MIVHTILNKGNVESCRIYYTILTNSYNIRGNIIENKI